MSTALRMPTQPSRSSRRVPVLGAVSVAVAAVSITVTLALVGGGGDGTTAPPSAAPATATPDRATLYQRSAEAPQSNAPVDGNRAAERFHHFR